MRTANLTRLLTLAPVAGHKAAKTDLDRMDAWSAWSQENCSDELSPKDTTTVSNAFLNAFDQARKD